MIACPSAPVLTLDNTTFVIFACSELPMNPMVNAPIHAATTTLSAFALFLNFLKFICFYTLLGLNIRSIHKANKYYDLIHNIIDVSNATTPSELRRNLPRYMALLSAGCWLCEKDVGR